MVLDQVRYPCNVFLFTAVARLGILRQPFRINSLSSRHASISFGFVAFEAYVIMGVETAIIVGLHDICDLDLIVDFILLDMDGDPCIVTMDVRIVAIRHKDLGFWAWIRG